MRVISGKYKGRALRSPHGEVRPTSDIAKGSLFSVLENKGLVRGARVLDVFCGTGALGIEALSRGADSCVFADLDTSNAEFNLNKIGIATRLVRGDYRRSLRLLRADKFDLIFCDPPYASGFADDALELFFKYDMIEQDGAIIIEHSSSNDLKNIPQNCIIDRRVFGVSALDIIMRGADEGDSLGSV